MTGWVYPLIQVAMGVRLYTLVCASRRMSGDPPPPSGPPAWEFLLSHHLPGRLDRTFPIPFRGGKVHLCARCTGEAVGILLFVALLFLSPLLPFAWSDPLVEVLFALGPLPAAVDWLTQSLGLRESWNGLRLVSGTLLGLSIAFALSLLAEGRWTLFALSLGVAALYLGAVSTVLFRSGRWREVVEEHFPGVMDGPRSHPPSK